MPFNIILHTVHKDYPVEYHAAYSNKHYAIQYMLHTVCKKHYAVQYHKHTVSKLNAIQLSCCYMVRKHYAIQYRVTYSTQTYYAVHISSCIYVRKHYAIQYHAAYSTQALCHSNIMLHTVRKHYIRSIACCIQYIRIMPFNIVLHTVRKHYAVQYQAAYCTQALCRSISCCIQYTNIMPLRQYQVADSMYALCRSISCCIQYASIMPFNILLHTVRKHYAVKYHVLHTVHKHYAIQYHVLHTVCKALCVVQYHAAYSNVLFNAIKYHAVIYIGYTQCIYKQIQHHSAYSTQITLCCLQKQISWCYTVRKLIMLFNIMYAYSTQALCHSISSCRQYIGIMPFINKYHVLHTVFKHYAIQYHAVIYIHTYCMQALCCFFFFFFLCKSPLTRLKSHCSVRGYKLLLQQKLIDPPLECCEIVICWKAFIGEGVPNGCGSRKKA